MSPLPPTSGRPRSRIAILAALVAGVSLAHYLTPSEHFLLHNIYQRLYYIPVLLACAWFGLAGGLATAAASAASYVPHILLHWKHSEAYQTSQMLELAMFVVVALGAGLLSDRQSALRLQAEQAAESLRRADRLAALGTLTAGMAHEIRNPLGAVAGAAEILEQDYPQDHPRREFLDILRREIARLNAIAGKYLDFSRPQGPEPRALQVDDLVREAVDLVRKSAGGSAVEVAYEPAPALPAVIADPGQVRQVLVNLLINGVQVMPPGGGRIEVSTRETASGVEVAVRDHGPGLPGGDAERPFEPYFTTKPGGTGLGLAISRRIAESHGGTLVAENAEGGGARFRLELPRASREGR
jgi:signal transduction histidine kinase